MIVDLTMDQVESIIALIEYSRSLHVTSSVFISRAFGSSMDNVLVILDQVKSKELINDCA